MKPTNNIKKIIAVTALFISLTQYVTAQAQQKFAARYINSMEASLSGGGHGAFYVATVGIELQRNTFSAGPVIQKRSGIVNGFKIAYSRNLSQEAYDPNDRDLLQVNLFSSFQYNNKLPLCYAAAKHESVVNPTSDRDWNELKLSTAEINSGIQLQVNITNNVSWKSSIGASVYHHLDYVKMDRRGTGVALTVGTGLSIIIN